MIGQNPLVDLDSLGASRRSAASPQTRAPLQGSAAGRAARTVPIIVVAAALGLPVSGRRTTCFNGQAHQGGHDDHPSLTFFSDSGRFKCFSCGVHGDAIDLVRAIRGVSFREAIDWLQKLPASEPPGPTDAPSAPVPSPSPQAVEVYGELFRRSNPPTTDSPAGMYLANQRGLNLDLAVAHGVRVPGLVPLGTLDDVALAAAGLLSRNGNFLFGQHPLWFFFLDGDRPVHVRARDITGESQVKELAPVGLPCSLPYNSNLLANPRDEVYICEGCIDTLSALQLGYPAIGVPGTNGFRREWVHLLRNVGRVHVLFDNDESGRRQGAELRTLLRLHGINADLCHPAHGKDVNEMLLHLRQGAPS